MRIKEITERQGADYFILEEDGKPLNVFEKDGTIGGYRELRRLNEEEIETIRETLETRQNEIKMRKIFGTEQKALEAFVEKRKEVNAYQGAFAYAAEHFRVSARQMAIPINDIANEVFNSLPQSRGGNTNGSRRA